MNGENSELVALEVTSLAEALARTCGELLVAIALHDPQETVTSFFVGLRLSNGTTHWAEGEYLEEISEK